MKNGCHERQEEPGSQLEHPKGARVHAYLPPRSWRLSLGQETLVNHIPGKEKPGISMGTTTDGLKGTDLTMISPTVHITSRNTLVSQDGEREAQWVLLRPAEGKNLLGNPLMLSTMSE